jgi:DNA-binding MarR family transcriptional regulator
MTPGHLAQVEFVQPQSLTRVLAEMTHGGLVVRSDHPVDGRQFLISLTDRGRQSLSEDMRNRDAWLEASMMGLTPTERALLGIAAGLMERMAGAD